MNDKHPFLGYGYSPGNLEAYWQERGKDHRIKGPDCPLTADLLDLAVGLADATTAAELRAHISQCEYCASRFQAQLRAAEQANRIREESSGPVPGEQLFAAFAERCQRVRSGSVERLELAVAASGAREISQGVSLSLPGPEAARDRWYALLHWAPGKEGPSRPGGKPWSFLLRFPTPQDNSARGNSPAALDYLDRRRVRLAFLPFDWSWVHRVETRLFWNPKRTAIISDEETVYLDDPERIKEVKVVPGDLVEEYDAS